MSAIVAVLTTTARKAVNRPFSLPRPHLDIGNTQKIMQDSSWADGLRGIAAVFVVSSHMVLCFARRLVLPCCGDDGHSVHVFQRPILRLVAQGQPWVALFFILSGFVNALKPLKLARAGQVETALSSMAVSSFRRTFRLMLPAAAATVLSWFVCQFGAYERSRLGDAYWLYTYTPEPGASWGQAVEELFAALRASWTLQTNNPYDQPQWALLYLLQGSMMIFCALLITVNLTPTYRTLVLSIFALWSFDWSYKFGDPLVGFTVFLGVVLSEFSLSTLPTTLASYSLLLSPPLIILALTLMSFPSDAPLTAPWSAYLAQLGPRIFPLQHDYARTYGSVGGLLLVSAIVISPHARALLSTRPLRWLGKVSFPIYLLHGTFMRSVFAWLMFGGKDLVPITEHEPDGSATEYMRYPQPGPVRIAVAVVVSMACCAVAAHWWAKKVEPKFGLITKWAEERMFGIDKDGGGVGVTGRPMLPVRKE